jgi:hypothetical protein
MGYLDWRAFVGAEFFSANYHGVFLFIAKNGFIFGYSRFFFLKNKFYKCVHMGGIKNHGFLIRQVALKPLAGDPYLSFATLRETMGAFIVFPSI